MVFDEANQEYRPRYGYKRANSGIEEIPIVEVKPGQDPYADPWAEARADKKARIKKNTKAMLKNQGKASGNSKSYGEYRDAPINVLCSLHSLTVTIPSAPHRPREGARHPSGHGPRHRKARQGRPQARAAAGAALHRLHGQVRPLFRTHMTIYNRAVSAHRMRACDVTDSMRGGPESLRSSCPARSAHSATTSPARRTTRYAPFSLRLVCASNGADPPDLSCLTFRRR